MDHFQDKEASALVVDGVLQDFFIDNDIPTPGQIYRATVDRPIKGQGGCFLKTPDGSAFLRQGKGLSQGSRLLVQVSGFAETGKAIPVSRKILLKSRYVIITPENTTASLLLHYLTQLLIPNTANYNLTNTATTT